MAIVESLPSHADVAIVGAGAAGLATAIFAARRSGPCPIVLLDGARKIGAKILVSGGGRCNVTNVRVTTGDYCGGSRHVVGRILGAFDHVRTAEWFRELGVTLYEEEFGKLFPETNRARTVLEALMQEAERCGVRLLADHRVTGVERTADGFALTTVRGQLAARRVVLATGGLSLPKTGSDGGGYQLAQSLGHSLVPTTPALVPLVLEGDMHERLSGITHEAEVCVTVEGVSGATRLHRPLLWTHFGVSGPVVMDASRHWHRAMIEGRQPRVTLNLLPGESVETVEQRLLRLAEARSRLTVVGAVGQWLPHRLAAEIVARLSISQETTLAHLSRSVRRQLASAVVAWPLAVAASRGYAYAEATAGGIPLTEIDPRSMESRRCPGLFLVGEILDVDGRIGGFNFQWAWSSAWVAGGGLAEARLRGSRSSDL